MCGEKMTQEQDSCLDISADRLDADSSAPARRRSPWLRVAAVLAGSLSALIVAEAVVRVLDIKPALSVVAYKSVRRSENMKLGYELAPGSADGRRLRISSAGLRDREFSESRPDGTFRIAAVGDSITYGYGCPRAQSYPKFLERFLHAARRPDAPKFEVMNFGVTGYNAPKIAEVLRARVPPFSPDLVIWAYSANDPQEFVMEMKGLAMVEADAERFVDERRKRGWAPLLQRSRLAMLMWERTLELPDEPPPCTDPLCLDERRAPGIRYLLGVHSPEGMQRVDAVIQQLARYDTPSVGPQGQNSGDARSTRAVLAIPPLDIWNQPGEDALRESLAAVADLAADVGVAVVDLDPAVTSLGGEAPSWLFDDILHPNPVGQKYIAAGLFCELAELGILRREWFREAFVNESLTACGKYLIENVE